jgi:hypothetical protein
MPSGTGNVQGDPMLGSDYAPAATSPAVGHANPASMLSIDFYGKPRPVGSADMGAVEH